MTPRSSLAGRLIAPLDRVRLSCLRGLGPTAIPLIRRRGLRVTVSGILLVGISLALAIQVPWWLLALGPILWGVPHLVADIRYLVVRPGLHRRRPLWFAAGVPLLIAGCGIWSVPSGLSAAAMAILWAHGPAWRKVTVWAVILPLIVVAAAAGDRALLVFAHAHNFVALAMWWLWRSRVQAGWQWIVPGFFVTASVAIWLGWVTATGTGFPAGLGEDYHLGWLAPGLEQPWGGRLVILFAFAQAVHYGVWLRLIPEEDRPQPTPRTFAASLRSLRGDMGSWLLAGAAVLALGLAVWATFDLIEARATYLRMALFHGYLEVAGAAFLFVEGWKLRR